jgi:hypothetical protein
MIGFSRHTLEVPCTIEIEHTAESLHAHVELKAPIELEPGDEVHVHGPPVHTTFGDRIVLDRMATVTRVGPLRRWVTRALAYLELTELYEVGFSPRSAS